MKVGFVSLGCSKNLIDTEMTIGLFKKNHFEIVNNPSKADIIVVNTCGFIETAKEEAINTIFEMAEYKKQGCKYLIVMGCLVQRYQEELKKAIPEVDLFISIDEYKNLWDKIEKLIPKELYSCGKQLEYLDREITTGNKMAYLKIAEGCSNCCTYCAIPMIRGAFVSRKMEEIIEEAEKLAEKGMEELIVIAQDTTKYGIDIYGKPMLAELLERLCKIDSLKWIRFLYAYPETITDELIATVKNNSKICNYFDIPIQHISDSVLKRMNRKSNGASIRKLMQKLREEIPDVIIRTTLIVGFPGETEENFQELYDFVEQTRFDKLGVFPYSKEEGTPASKLKEQIHPQTKKKRYRQIMELQQKISEEKGKEKIGETYSVLIEHISFDSKYLIGRSYMDVPDMDGVIYVQNEEGIKAKEKIGKWVNVEIIQCAEYDLIGKEKK